MIAPHTWQNRSPGDLSIEMPEVAACDVESVLAGAAAAARDWARLPFGERAACLRRAQSGLAVAKDELARLIAMETGKPISEALGEMGAVIAKFDLTLADAEAHLATREIADGPHPAQVRTRARGPAVVIGPFNFPLHLANGALLAHLAAGNPAIFKPSPLGAWCAQRYAEIVGTCFPPGVFTLAQGGAEEGQALCLDPRVRAVCFTGSVPVGRTLARALAEDFSKDLALELGGHNALIVAADADVPRAALAAAEGACLTCGQRCNATSRVYVEECVAADFERHFLDALTAWRPGDPLDPATKLGPLISEAAVRRYERLCAEKAEWLVPGRIVPEVNGKHGWWVTPAVRRGSSMPEAETFVPIIEIERVDDLDEAVARQAASPFGLAASVFTRSREIFERVAAELPVGNVYANLPTTFSPGTLPFGGLGCSGNGRPGGRGFTRWTTVEQAVQIATDSLDR